MTFSRLKATTMALVATISLATSAIVMAQPQVPWTNGGPLLPDSSNFVTASLLIASPGEPIYSQLGHAALRMECPVHNLDFCFSFEEEPGMGGILKFFLGKTDAHMIAIPTAEFLAEFEKEGRQVDQYTLSLSTHEKQELWRLLDNDYVDPEMRKFNYLQNNCSSVSLIALESVMDVEKIDFHGWPEPFKLVNGAGVRFLSRLSPWLEFWNTTFLGTESDVFWKQEQRVAPELLPDVIKKATIVSTDGTSRAMVIGEKQLLPLVNKFQASPVTPTWVFGALLLIAVLITLAQLRWKFRWLPRMLDIVLMTLVTIAGLLLIYTSFVSGLFGKHWNWYLIPFNPLPLIIWLIWRKRKGYYKVYLLYTVVLVLFILATPLSEQLDLPHQLITATLAVRCLYNYYEGRR
ncbi:MAG: DUF4105 domain-containing protein, partial [Muribaculaceae bacterium]|nr:DUF4105 domain-containing protein [Muribaculaceae bacterium]